MKSWLIWAYVGLATISLGYYGHYMLSGKEAGSPTRKFVPSDVRAQARSSSKGYRSFHFWHVGYGGYRGGK